MEDISKFKVKLFTYNYRDAGGFFNVMLQKLHSFLLLRAGTTSFTAEDLIQQHFSLAHGDHPVPSDGTVMKLKNASACSAFATLPLPSKDEILQEAISSQKTPVKDRALKISLKDNHSKKPRVIPQVNKKLFGLRNAGFKLHSERGLGTVLYT